MKTERNILTAFILNLSFSIFEIVGGALTGSVAIISDAVHDFGDALSIGSAYFLEKKSKKTPDEKYTYGYARYSVLGCFITTLILLAGSAFMIFNSVKRIVHPTEINYNGMIIVGVIGVCVNFCAAVVTHRGSSLNQRAVNLHMLEDVLSWIVVLVGAVIMRFTDFAIIDPVMSIGVSVFILINAVKNLKEIARLFLVEVPDGIEVSRIKAQIEEIDGVIDVHHIHVWSMDGNSNYATVHVVTDSDRGRIKAEVKNALNELGVFHVTAELEGSDECCTERQCRAQIPGERHSHGHHSHGHHSHGHHSHGHH